MQALTSAMNVIYSHGNENSMYVCIMVCIFYSLLPPYSVESIVILTVNHVPPLHMHSAVECAAVSVSSMDLADNYHHDQQKEGRKAANL